MEGIDAGFEIDTRQDSNAFMESLSDISHYIP